MKKPISIILLTAFSLALLLSSCALINAPTNESPQEEQSTTDALEEQQSDQEETQDDDSQEDPATDNTQTEQQSEEQQGSGAEVTSENLFAVLITINRSMNKTIVTLNRGQETRTLDLTDPDALIFDIAQEFDRPIGEVQDMTTVVGELEEEVVVEKPKIELTGEWVFEEKDEGLVRYVGCNFLDRKLNFTIHNTFDFNLTFFREVAPYPPNPLRIRMNSVALTGFACADNKEVIEPGEEVSCYDEDIFFVHQKEGIGPEIKDRFGVQIPGSYDLVEINCI